MQALLTEPRAHVSLQVSKIKSEENESTLRLPWDPHLYQESRGLSKFVAA